MDARHGASAPDGTRATPGSATAGAVTVRYWAGARAAAGVDAETLPVPGSVGALTAALADAHPALGSVLPVCSLLVDGLAASGDDSVPPGAVVEVPPPFAGG